MLARIEALFGSIPAGEPIETVSRPEPPQRGERRVKVHGPGDAAYLLVAYRAPAASHPDYYALALLNAAFAGGSSLGFFSSGGTNKISRLYRALVASELAAGVSGSVAPTIDPYLYTIAAVARPGRALAEIEAALEAEVARLASEPINEAELAKAMKRAKAQFALAGESVTGQAQLMGMAEAVAGDYQWYENVLDRLSTVQLADLDRVRQQYLTPVQRTVGFYEPLN
jgi:zinc protease